MVKPGSLLVFTQSEIKDQCICIHMTGPVKFRVEELMRAVSNSGKIR